MVCHIIILVLGGGGGRGSSDYYRAYLSDMLYCYEVHHSFCAMRYMQGLRNISF